MKNNLQTLSKDYERIACAIGYLESNSEEQPELNEVARQVGLSASHFQRLFSRWAGISPKRFLQYLTLNHTKQVLRDCDENLLDTTYGAGLSSISRLHDLYVQCESMTPAEYRAMGEGLTIHYGFHPTPFGECLIGTTSRGLCGFLFVHQSRDETMQAMVHNWERAAFSEDKHRTQPLCDLIFASVGSLDKPLYLLVKGTPFQIKVWEALLRIPRGAITSYQNVAASIEHPRSYRAVANAVANNPLHYVIPCHRVIQNSGTLGGYRAGPLRKKIILGWEAAQTLNGAGVEHRA